ncbi:hypothetical protein [Pseudomonas sp. LB3P31]
MNIQTLIIAGTFIISGQLLTVIWIFMSAHRLTDLAESYLNKSKFVSSNRIVFESLGLMGKVVRSGSIAMMFLAPKLFEKRGMIDARELSNMPTSLRNKLIMPWIAGTLFLIAMFFIN